MARIAGIDVPPGKAAWVSLTYVFGIGTTLSRKILHEAAVPARTKIRDLNDDQLTRINAIIDKNYVVEGSLRRIINQNIQRLKDIQCYRGMRHRRGLPVRGQRTKTNARTRKGKVKTVAGKKQAKSPT